MLSPQNKRKAPNIENFLATVLDLCNVDYAVHIAVLTTKYNMYNINIRSRSKYEI